nr:MULTISPECIES: ABC transporter ATP-binding protein [Oscillospiraceae]
MKKLLLCVDSPSPPAGDWVYWSQRGSGTSILPPHTARCRAGPERESEQVEPILQVQNLHKKIGKKAIIRDASFAVMPGEIMGFLGPNGAGKTTTIKMILGLLKVDSGSIQIGPYDGVKDPERARSLVGGIIENPEMYGHLTGRQNLQVYANMCQGVSRERIDEVVRQVKLENRIGDKVRRYSLGMRQRLGVAQAILHRPKLLILDEPTNGLDPVGIKELRDTLRQLADEEEVGVLISSHQLAEMELMCDRVCIVDAGQIVAVRDLRAERNAAGQSDQSVPTLWEVSDPQRAAELLAALFPQGEITPTAGGVQLSCSRKQRAAAVRQLCESGVEVYSVIPHRTSLEELFLETTTGSKGQIQ